MVQEQYSFQVAVWKHTYTPGLEHTPEENQKIFHSPQQSWSQRHKAIVLRPVGADAVHGAWANTNPSLVSRSETDPGPVFVDADGVIITNDWGEAIRQDGMTPEGALVAYHRGERIWVERSLEAGADEDGTIPVISLDSLEVFRIPLKHVCFVPQRSKTDEHGKRHYATTAVVVQHHLTTITTVDIDSDQDEDKEEALQGYFTWPVDEPDKLTLSWDGWWPFTSAKLLRNVSGYRPLWDLEARNHAFQQQWAAMATITANSEAPERGNSEARPEGTVAEDSVPCVSPSAASPAAPSPDGLRRSAPGKNHAADVLPRGSGRPPSSPCHQRLTCLTKASGSSLVSA